LITLGCGGVAGGKGVARFGARWSWRAWNGRIVGVVSRLSTPGEVLAAGVTDPPAGSAITAPPPGVITTLGAGRTAGAVA
jgi:hypothetical protein